MEWWLFHNKISFSEYSILVISGTDKTDQYDKNCIVWWRNVITTYTIFQLPLFFVRFRWKMNGDIIVLLPSPRITLNTISWSQWYEKDSWEIPRKSKLNNKCFRKTHFNDLVCLTTSLSDIRLIFQQILQLGNSKYNIVAHRLVASNDYETRSYINAVAK